MYPTHPIRTDLESGIRGAIDLAGVKNAVIRAFESFMYDVSDHAGRIDYLARQVSELEDRVARAERAIRALERP